MHDEIIPDAVALYAYGGGSGLIHFSGFHCTGNESHLINCSVEYSEYQNSSSQYSGSEDVYCRHNDDAGVVCPSSELKHMD